MFLTGVFLVLLVLAAGCLGASALNRTTVPFNLLAAGLFFWVLVPLISTIDKLLQQ